MTPNKKPTPTADSAGLVSQTKLAFDLLQRLYIECSLLVRELELLLNREQERFVIAKPTGYGVTTRRSVGLDPLYVQLWLLRKFSVVFVPEAETQMDVGVTRTPLRVRPLYFRFVLDDYSSMTFAGAPLQQPTVVFGVFDEVTTKGRVKKLEELLAHIEYRDTAVFRRLPVVEYEDAAVHIVGKCDKVSLFELTDGASVGARLAAPALSIYRSAAPDRAVT